MADEELRREAMAFYRLLAEHHDAVSPGAEILARVIAKQLRSGRRRSRAPVGSSPLCEVVAAGDLSGGCDERGTERRGLFGRPCA